MDMRKLVIEFAKRNKSQSKLKFINEDQDGIVVGDIHADAVLNYVVRVTSKDGDQSVIIKYGEEKLRALDMTLSIERQSLEFNALKLLHSIHPGCVPEPYCFDKDFKTMAMEDLSSMSHLGPLLRKGEFQINHARMMGDIFSSIHYQTQRDNVDEEKWKYFLENLRLESSKKFISAFRFLDPFQEDHPNTHLEDGYIETYRDCVKDLKNLGMQEKLFSVFNKEECVIHCDVHWFTLFVSDERVAMFDMEFATVGNPAYDVAFIMCGFIVCQYDSSVKYSERKEELYNITKNAIHTFMESYFKGRKDLSTPASKADFLSEVILFLGATLFIVPLFPVHDHLTLNVDQRRHLLQTGCILMKAHKDSINLEEIIEKSLWK